MEGGPARWQKVSDAVAGFLRADGKLAPIYAIEVIQIIEEVCEIANHDIARRIFFDERKSVVRKMDVILFQIRSVSYN